MTNQIQTQQIMEVMVAMTTLAIIAIGFRMIDRLLLEPQAGQIGKSLGEPKFIYGTIRKLHKKLENAVDANLGNPNPMIAKAANILSDALSWFYDDEIILYVGSLDEIKAYASYYMYRDTNLRAEVLHITSFGSLTDTPGTGKIIMDEVIHTAKYHDCDAVAVHPDEESEGFYRKLGFIDYPSEEYKEDLIYWIRKPPKQWRGSPSSVKLYHCTNSSNVSSVMKNGLLSSESASGMLFFFPNLQVAEEAGLSGMAILEVSITEEEIDKCEIGETFPELYTERIGGEPPADTTLREYIRNPIAYGIPEVCCTIDKIPVDRIKYVKTIRR